MRTRRRPLQAEVLSKNTASAKALWQEQVCLASREKGRVVGGGEKKRSRERGEGRRRGQVGRRGKERRREIDSELLSQAKELARSETCQKWVAWPPLGAYLQGGF